MYIVYLSSDFLQRSNINKLWEHINTHIHCLFRCSCLTWYHFARHKRNNWYCKVLKRRIWIKSGRSIDMLYAFFKDPFCVLSHRLTASWLFIFIKDALRLSYMELGPIDNRVLTNILEKTTLYTVSRNWETILKFWNVLT